MSPVGTGTWGLAVAVVCGVLVACSGSSGSSASVRGSRSVDSSTSASVAGGSRVSSEGEGGPGGRRSEARAVVYAVRGSLPYPDDVVECLVTRAAADGRVLAGLRGVDPGRSPSVLSAASSCVVAIAGASRFVDGLQALSTTRLTRAQRACAAERYSALPSDRLQALTGAVLDPASVGSDGAVGEFDRIVRECGIVLKGGS